MAGHDLPDIFSRITKRNKGDMFNWTYSKTVPIQAMPEHIWDIWQDTENWPSWDHSLNWVRLEGPFAKGAKGLMKLKTGLEVAFVLTEPAQRGRICPTPVRDR